MSDHQPFIAPAVLVQDQIADGEDVLTVILGSILPYGAPLAPAALYDLETERLEAFPLHKLLSGDADTWKFRTFKQGLPVVPVIGQRYVYRPWWTPRAWDLVTDASRVWRKMIYPRDAVHVHCEITFAQIGEGKNSVAYLSDGAWITSEAYERFVCNDEFHCRR